MCAPSTDRYIKDPAAVLDYGFDWSDWLESSETITAHTVTADTGLTVDSTSAAGGIVTAWLSGGTVGAVYRVTCQVETSAGRVDERTMTVRVVER